MSVKILVVDDSRLVRQQVVRALTGGGFSVIEAADGIEGLQKLSANPDTRLVVCDVNMPNMNGFEFLEQVRKDRGPRVVMLTTEGDPNLVQKAKALGAMGWIVKPFKPELLVAAAKKQTQSPAA